MIVKKWIAGTAVAAIAVTGLVLSAPSASAALCGYPPVECAAGDTNPPTDTPIGETPREQAQAGMTLPDQQTADATPPTKPADPPAKDAIGEAPKVTASKGDVVKLRADATPAVTYR
ncbi:MAG: hypothetical protein PSX37_08585, partial [bacterium]|nr:hypothetical protein [bacterium]